MDVKILELDLNSPGDFMDEFSLILEKENFDGIVFAHRYRGDLDNHHERYQVEVLSPYAIAKLFCNIKSKKIENFYFLLLLQQNIFWAINLLVITHRRQQSINLLDIYQ